MRKEEKEKLKILARQLQSKIETHCDDYYDEQWHLFQIVHDLTDEELLRYQELA